MEGLGRRWFRCWLRVWGSELRVRGLIMSRGLSCLCSVGRLLGAEGMKGQV